tara:strand:+ start:597 stop:1037 length:441 start_codon:yes stop_codon:yes gene_type:complete
MLQKILNDINENWQHIYAEKENDIREYALSKLTKKYASISMGYCLKAKDDDLSEDEKKCFIETELYLICEDEEGNKLAWSDLGIEKYKFEWVGDYLRDIIYDFAKSGAEQGSLVFPDEIRQAIIDGNGKYSYWGENIYWNDDEQVY